MTGLSLSVEIRGPLFTGAATKAAREAGDAAVDRVGAYALQEVQHNLDQSIRNPTPYYETQITFDRRGHDGIVWDRGVVYGAWLEGVGSRNRSTRFKGYRSFRRAHHSTEREAKRLAEEEVKRFIPRMGG